ncbi:MAG: Mur ligase family protein, partial [Paracoccaceae bacterium]
KLLYNCANAGVTHGAMEASSHGLAQRRLDGARLRAAGFTNFTQDHLDYHTSFEAYFDAKAGLFFRVLPPTGVAVINIDDPKLAPFAERLRKEGQKTITVGRSMDADLRLLAQKYDPAGQTIRFSYDGKTHQSFLPLIGGFQGENVLMAAALCIATGQEGHAVFEVLRELKTVRGRMEHAATRANGATVFVDYAHTPDAVETAINAYRPHVMGRLIAIIGAGGDRDPTKRPLMGAAAAQSADYVVVTDDNPRSEDPKHIRNMVLEGTRGQDHVIEIGDRAEAILRAIDMLETGDGLLITGKGHETGQIIGDDVLPFNDVEQASVAVAALDGVL